MVLTLAAITNVSYGTILYAFRAHFKTSIRVSEAEGPRAKTKEPLRKNRLLPMHTARLHQVLKCTLSVLLGEDAAAGEFDRALLSK